MITSSFFRHCCLLFALFMFAVCGMGQAQEVAEGQWIHLFDGETLFGWISLGDPDWAVEGQILTASKGSGGSLATTSQFKDFELMAKVRVSGRGAAGLSVRSPLEGHPAENGGATIQLPAGKKNDPWTEIKVRVVGDTISASLNGNPVDGLAVSRPQGHILLQYQRYHRDARRTPTIEVQEIKVRPLNLTPLFNGKDLTGWNIIPGHASKFNVVEGAINITDGNGQIETDGLYKNFLLQLDIFSNGEHLNSGVFFRGPKGKFWLGYESQVRNEWHPKRGRAYPEDFGTGGIYGVQEARKVVSSDHEWFNKTILCNGNHMAVWINGYQVSDLYDTRPVVENGDGKNGFVPDAGTIHLQGHDPTTDLSFKHIYIQEY